MPRFNETSHFIQSVKFQGTSTVPHDKLKHIGQCYSKNMKRVFLALSTITLGLFPILSTNAQSWTAKLDQEIKFYQSTELGVVVTGTEKSLYAIDSSTGDILWRRKNVTLDETDVAPVPGTDLLLLSFEKSENTRVEAVDILTGDSIWRSDKIKGGLMHLAVEPNANLLAIVLVIDAKEKVRNGFKRRPQVHLLDLASGDELWKYEAGEVEMMPTDWPEDEGKEVYYTLDNYYPPAFVDGRLYLFYDGVTSFDSRGGKERLRERYRVNEEGLALTEAEPIFSDSNIYVSGRGHLRAISRQSGDTIWEAKDLGLTPEMFLVGNTILARTGGLFTRIKDGETVERGAYGVSAVDAITGKVLWRYKGADKGITNLLLPDSDRVALADRDDLIFVNMTNGKRLTRISHKIEKPAFGFLNERGDIVIGGQSEIAAFDRVTGRELWRARHTPPGRGVLRTIAAITARAASLYLRFGGTAMTAVRGVQIARAATSLSWSGLATRSSFSNLQALVTSSTRSYNTSQFKQFGIASRLSRGNGGASWTVGSLTRKRTVDVEERLLDRLDPSNQLDRLSRFLWHKDRLATLRGHWMYFYTDLRTRDGNGLAGVNINTGQTEREIRLKELDERFVTDEVIGLLYSANGSRLIAQPLR
jgi:outer membrane protein assembly factor BamB